VAGKTPLKIIDPDERQDERHYSVEQSMRIWHIGYEIQKFLPPFANTSNNNTRVVMSGDHQVALKLQYQYITDTG
jgi:hypothetical protein